MVPVALINDSHFWGALACAGEVAIGPVDKGEHAALLSDVGKGLCPNPSGGDRDAAHDTNGRGRGAARTGKGLCPDPSGCAADGLDDGEPPEAAFPPAD
eukprot:5199661-Lingulodinium_polyedra.AAC.1